VTQGQYVAAVYGVVFVVVLAYVAIIAAKLARLQRETAELLELVRRKQQTIAPEPMPRSPARAGRRDQEVPRIGVTRPVLVGRPLPLQVPTAFVRIRVRGPGFCGEVRRAEVLRPCPPARVARRTQPL
jgi:hypothetical protein